MNEKTANTISKGYGYFRLGLTDLAHECFEIAIEEISKTYHLQLIMRQIIISEQL